MKKFIPLILDIASIILLIIGATLILGFSSETGIWFLIGAGIGFGCVFLSGEILSGKTMNDLDFWL